MLYSPLITIVVPVYKVPESMLRKCLDSICAQTCQNFEALLVDDGSPDDCGRICDEYANQYPFMRVIHQENGGLSVVRNVGIDQAVGEWVCFVDGDDWIEPDTMEFAAHYISDCPKADVLIWDEYFDTPDESFRNCFLGRAWSETVCFENEKCNDLIEYILPAADTPTQNTYSGIGTANARLYSRAFLIENHLYNQPGLKRSQDIVFNVRVFHAAKKIYYCGRNLYHYICNENSATKKYTPGFANTVKFFGENLMAALTETGNKKYLPRANLRLIRMFGLCFEQDFANPSNPSSLWERRKNAKAVMESPFFAEVIHAAPDNGQFKTHITATLLKHHMYFSLMLLSRINALSRVMQQRLKQRGE